MQPNLPAKPLISSQENPRRKRAWRRRLLFAGAALGSFLLILGLALVGFGDAILSRYGRGKVERAFAHAHPGCALQLGKLAYAFGPNRLVVQAVSVHTPQATLATGRTTLQGVGWVRLLSGSADLADSLAQADLDATNVVLTFPQTHYGIQTARLRASVAGSELIAEGTVVQPLGGDEEFFAALAFRRTRLRLHLPECRVVGLDYRALLQGTSYRAEALHLSQPVFAALLNRDKPPAPFKSSPPMVHEALASIQQTLRIGSVNVTNGRITYSERLAPGTDPAVLTFGAVNLSVDGIRNHGQRDDVIQVRGQGLLMETGSLRMQMTIPVSPDHFSLQYSGSLGEMDLPHLDDFLVMAEHTRVKSGFAREASFEIEVVDGQARGTVQARYRDLEFALLDKQSGNEDGLVSRTASFFAKLVKIRKANPPEGSAQGKVGQVNYTRRPEDDFLLYVWFALRTGVLDVITH